MNSRIDTKLELI